MSTSRCKINDLSADEISNKIESLIKYLKKTGIDLDAYSGLKRQSKSQYKTRGRLPSFATLFFWATELDVNLHWLLLNEGPMFRKEIRDAVKRSEEAEERIRELKYTVELQKEKIEQLEKQDGFLKTAVLGAGTAARSSHIDTDR